VTARRGVGLVVVSLFLGGSALLPSAARAGTACAFETEPNDTLAQAVELSFLEIEDGCLSSQADVDWYAIDAEAESHIWFDVERYDFSGRPYIDPVLRVYAPDGTTILADLPGLGGRIVARSRSAGLHYLRLTNHPDSASDGALDYSIRAATSPWPSPETPFAGPTPFEPVQPLDFDPMERMQAQAADVEDLTGDGRDDIVVAMAPARSPWQVRLFVSRQRPDGWLARRVFLSRVAHQAFQYGEFRIDAGRLDGDGRLDVAIATRLGVLMVFDVGTSDESRTFVPTPHEALAATIGNFDKDGRVDLLVRTTRSMMLIERAPGGWHRSRLLDRYFDDVDAGDVTGDGRRDLVGYDTAGDVGTMVQVYPQRADGTLGRRILLDPQTDILYGVEARDVTGDGRADVIASASSILNVWVRRPGGGFRRPVAYSGVSQFLSGVTAFDLNGDGRNDVVAGGHVWFQEPDGTLGRLVNFGELDLRFATDLNGDGHTDLTSGFAVMRHRFEV
jgi:hypothetical protein